MSDFETIGLIGTGKIGSAVMTGFLSEGMWQPKRVMLSTRSATKSKALKTKFGEKVTVTQDLQRIIDETDIVFIGLLPNVATEVLPTLVFSTDKRVVSMMATIPFDRLIGLLKLPRECVVRTIPLPSASNRLGPILTYPQNDRIHKLLSHIGVPIMVNDEAQITRLTVNTSMISFFYAVCATLQRWCMFHGVGEDESRSYVSSFFESLAVTGKQSTVPFDEMSEEAATPGGLNEQVHRGLLRTGAYKLIEDQMDSIFTRLTGEAPAECPQMRAKVGE